MVRYKTIQSEIFQLFLSENVDAYLVALGCPWLLRVIIKFFFKNEFKMTILSIGSSNYLLDH